MPHGGEPPRREDWRRHDAREVFYAFHEDTVEFVSVLYPCTVHFVPYKRRADWDLAARNAASTPGLLCSRVHKPASDDSDAVVHCISDVKIYSTYNQKDRDVMNCAIQQTFEALKVKLEGVAVKTKKGAQPHTSLWLSAGDRVVHDPRKETKMTVVGAGAGAQAAAGKKRTHSTGKLDKLRTKKAKNSSDAAVKVVTPVQGVSAAAGAAPDIEEGDGDVPFPLSSPVEIPKDDDRLLQLLRAVSLRLKLLVSPKDWTVEDKRQIKELPDGDAIMNLEASPVLQILWWVPLTSNDRFNMIGEVQLGKIISELKKKHGKNEVGMKAAAVKNKWKTQLNRFAKEQEEKAEKEEEKEEKEEEKEQEQEEQEEQAEEEQEQEEQEEEEDGDDDDDGNEVNEGKVVSSSEEDGMADGEEEEEEEKKTVPQVVVIDNGSTDEESDKEEEEEEEDSEEEENAVPQVVIIDDGSTDDEGAI
ncbi:BAH domain-containing protein [Pycnococcus provasolii]